MILEMMEHTFGLYLSWMMPRKSWDKQAKLDETEKIWSVTGGESPKPPSVVGVIKMFDKPAHPDWNGYLSVSDEVGNKKSKSNYGECWLWVQNTQLTIN